MPGEWKPPTLRMDEARERHATWTELFYDLAVVVAVAVIGHRLSSHLTWPGLAEFALSFLPLWWAWAGMTFYADRFDTDDMLHRVLFFVQMAGVAGMAVFAHDAFGEGFAGFAVSYMVLRLVLVAFYLRAGVSHPAARGLVTRYVTGFLLALVPWGVAIALGPGLRHAVVLLGLVIDFATPHTAARHQAALRVSESHLPERFGLFTIIVLGETVAAVVRTCTEAHPTPLVLLTGLLSLVVAVSFWWLYFDNLDDELVRQIKGTFRGWAYFNLVFVAGLVLLSIGTGMLTGAVHEGRVAAHRLLFCAASFALCVVSLAVMGLLSESGESGSPGKVPRFLVMLASAGVALAASLVPALNHAVFQMALYALLGVCLVAVDTVLRPGAPGNATTG